MDRQDYAQRSLTGLWVGDCLGNMATLYYLHDILKLLKNVPVKGKCRWSDDTEEAVVLYEHVRFGEWWGMGNSQIRSDDLAKEFTARFMRDPTGEQFGYGPRTRGLFQRIAKGEDWRVVAKDIDSFGNGSAMRAAPLGPLAGMYQKDMDMDMLYLPRVKEMAYLQAEVTHHNIEGKAGSVAVALAASTAVWLSTLNESKKTYLLEGDEGHDPNDPWKSIPCEDFFKSTYGNALKSEIICNAAWSMGRKWKYQEERDLTQTQVLAGLKKAAVIPFDTPIGHVIAELGNGSRVTCQDTVPFALWCAAKNIDNYQQALIDCNLAGGDIDTTSAIVGGIVGIVTPPPQEWIDLCQPLDVRWK